MLNTVSSQRPTSRFDHWFGLVKTSLGGGAFLSICSSFLFPQSIERDLISIAVASAITYWIDRNERAR